MHDKDKACCGRFFIRVPLGLLFLGAGLMKLMDPQTIIGMLSGIGFPTPAFFGWLVILSEVLFGAAVLLGFRTKLTVWPLIIILIVAIITVTIPAWMGGQNQYVNLMFHLLGIAGLISLSMSGPGDFSLSKN